MGDENAAFTNRSFISLTESEREYHGESGRFLRISEQSAQCANLRSFPFLRKKAAPRTFDQSRHGDPVEEHFGKHFLKGGHDQFLGV